MTYALLNLQGIKDIRCWQGSRIITCLLCRFIHLPWLMGTLLLSGIIVSITSHDIFCFVGDTTVCCCKMSVILLKTSFNFMSRWGESSKKCSMSFIIVFKTLRKPFKTRCVEARSKRKSSTWEIVVSKTSTRRTSQTPTGMVRVKPLSRPVRRAAPDWQRNNERSDPNSWL